MAAAGRQRRALPSLPPLTLLVLPLCPPSFLLVLVVVLPLPVVLLLHLVDAVAVLALVALVAVAAEPLGQQLQFMLRVPPGDGEVPVARGTDVVAVGAQVEVVASLGVPAGAAAVPLTQEVAADLSGSRHVGDVLAEAMAQEGLHVGAVVLKKQEHDMRIQVKMITSQCPVDLLNDF